ncbi:eukaryotic translation initiation factor 4E-binding protein 2-like [Echeneis naucrates]|uniref:Eukaryotic translation initiation factor 4E-binding protein 2-like n=1 Tax=Echeneis naucrates TaxID=173247 RepID=A0A665VQ09_ECHNA|nr:eukaryotic translation initiation factor 4E-binding protein 2-like [Echeneis naucrates]
MSAGCQKSTAKAIPSHRAVTVSDAEHVPRDCCTTPGGTLFSTTPGGTRIFYDRKFLLECRSSLVAKTPPHGLPRIPGVTSPPAKDPNEKAHNGELLNNNIITARDTGDDAQFEMDI